MKTRILVAMVVAAVGLVIAPIDAVSEPAPSHTWVTTLAGISDDTIDDSVRVALAPTGEVIVLGFRRSVDDTQSAFLARLTKEGRVVWEKELEQTAPFMNPVGLILTAEGDIVTLLSAIDGITSSGTLSRFTPAGNSPW